MSEDQKRKRYAGLLLKILDVVTVVVSMVIAVGVILSYMAPYVNPNDTLWFAFLGLSAPFLYAANLVLMLYWIVRWRWIAVVLTLVALLGLGHVPKFFKPVFSRTYQQMRQPGTIRILSYNVEGFWGKDSLGIRENQMEEIANYVKTVNPDIICMQEFELNRINTRAQFDAILEPWKYSTFFFTTGSADGNGRGLAVYSKYPVIKRGGIHYPESANASMWVDVILHRDTLRIYNNHMQTTQVNDMDREYLNPHTEDSLGHEHMKDILRKLGRNFQIRASQADSVANFIHDGTPRVVVCGDFNDTPMSYTYQRMRGDLNDAFCREGRGLIYTYRGLLAVFRIDYLFLSDDLVTVNYDGEQPHWSDHNPVLVDLRFK